MPLDANLKKSSTFWVEILILIGEANFYRLFIQGFSKIVMSFILMLGTSSLINSSTSGAQIVFKYERFDNGDCDVGKLMSKCQF